MAQMRRWLHISAVMWMLAGSLPVGCMLTGCKGACGGMGTCGGTRQASCGLGDVRRTLAVADSMRVNHGVAYDDSLALAEAVAMVDTWWHRTFHPADYAKANYYYGRLLRNRGDQPAAMLAFLRAVHTDPDYPARAIRAGLPFRTVSSDEYSMLGRVYSNMANMCHLSQNHPLAKDIYEHSASMFLHAHDSLMYFYALNNIALEYAMQKQEKETLLMLDSIAASCTDFGLQTKLWETKAILYNYVGKYDSAIVCVNNCLLRGYYEPTGLLSKAQAFSYLGEKDSALYYAEKVFAMTTYSGDKYNALYILSHDDSTLDNQSILQLTSERDDVHTYEIEVQKIQYNQAVQLLRQDVEDSKIAHRHLRRSVKWSIGIVFVLAVICCMLWIAFHTKSKKVRATLEHHTHELQSVEKRMQTLYTVQERHQHEMLISIEKNSERLSQSTNLRRTLHLKNYKQFKTLINKDFYMLVNILEQYDKLEERDIIFCVMVLLGLSGPQIADLMYYSPKSIGTIKKRIIEKLHCPEGEDLRKWLISIILHGGKSAQNK